MPKKGSVGESIKGGFKVFSDIVFGNLIPKLSRSTEDIMSRIEARAIVIEERIIRNLASMIVIGLAFLFFVFAAFYFLVDYWELDKAQAFLALGMGLLLVGLILKLKESR